MKLKALTRSSLSTGAYSALLFCGVSAIACQSGTGRVKVEQQEAAREAEEASLGQLQQFITVNSPPVWEDQFSTFSATTGSPVGSGKNWYIQKNFKPNGEYQLYGGKVCPDSYDPPGANTNLGTADSAVGIETDAANWSFCNVNDADKGAANALWIRAHNDGAGNIHSGRINTKRMAEFVPTATQGMKFSVRLRTYSASNDANPTHGHGFWPAAWFLQSRIAEAPIVGDNDSVSWPCEGAHEVDLYEHGSLSSVFGQAWGPNYNQSSMHYRNGYCIPQSVENSLQAGVYNDTIADNNYHVYSWEWELTKSRFYYDGTQYGPEFNVNGLKFEVAPMFWLINVAVGGALGGGNPDWSRFTGDYKSIFVDYAKVESFNIGASYTNIADTTDHAAATKLEAETNAGSSGVQMEACSDTGGGQDAGWIDALPDGTRDWIQWNVNVPVTADYNARFRSAVNIAAGAKAKYKLFVDGVQVASDGGDGSAGIPDTGGWQTWSNYYSSAFKMTAGNHVIKWQAESSGQNLNYITLAKVASNCNDWANGVGEGTSWVSASSTIPGIDCGGSACGATACPACNNGVKDVYDKMNWYETGVDCGGPCPACTGNGNGATVGSKLEAESAAGFQGTQIETTPGNGTTSNSVGYFDAGDWIKFTGVDVGSINGISIRAAGANSGGVLEVRKDTSTGMLLGTYTMSATGGWTTWLDRDVVFSASATGISDLYLVGKTGSGIMNIDHVTLISKDNSGGGGTGFPVAINNPSFANGTVTGWMTYFNNGGSAVATAGGANYWGRVNINGITSPAVRWHQQLYQTQVSDGGTYTFKISMHTTGAAKTIDCFIEQNGGSYTSYGVASVTSTGSSNWPQCVITSSAIPAGQSFKFGVRGGDTTQQYDVDDAELINN